MKRIVIVGAGIAGLTLAQALLKGKKFNFVVLESDAHADARPQGYSIALKAESGIRVIRELGLFGALAPLSQPLKSFTFQTDRGERLLQFGEQFSPDSDSKWNSLRIPRDALRKTLLKGLEDRIEWGVRVEDAREKGSGWEVVSSDGRVWEADFLVVCDGSNSALRRRFVSTGAQYSGLSSIQGSVSLDRIPFQIEPGTTKMILGPGYSFFWYTMPGALTWAWTTKAKQGAFRSVSSADLKKFVLQKLGKGSEEAKTLIQATETSDVATRGYYTLELPPKVPQGNVCLIGDSAHAMTPFQGQGANMAMSDAWDLSTELHSSTDGKLVSQRLFDSMRTRVGPVFQETKDAAERFHTRSFFVRWIRNSIMKSIDRKMHAAPSDSSKE